MPTYLYILFHDNHTVVMRKTSIFIFLTCSSAIFTLPLSTISPRTTDTRVLVVLTNSSTAFFSRTPNGLTDESTANLSVARGQKSQKAEMKSRK